jgi:hypothetical protein
VQSLSAASGWIPYIGFGSSLFFVVASRLPAEDVHIHPALNEATGD